MLQKPWDNANSGASAQNKGNSSKCMFDESLGCNASVAEEDSMVKKVCHSSVSFLIISSTDVGKAQ